MDRRWEIFEFFAERMLERSQAEFDRHFLNFAETQKMESNLTPEQMVVFDKCLELIVFMQAIQTEALASGLAETLDKFLSPTETRGER